MYSPILNKINIYNHVLLEYFIVSILTSRLSLAGSLSDMLKNHVNLNVA
jgi:hypothetical protein